jgi:hypothetical protein
MRALFRLVGIPLATGSVMLAAGCSSPNSPNNISYVNVQGRNGAPYRVEIHVVKKRMGFLATPLVITLQSQDGTPHGNIVFTEIDRTSDQNVGVDSKGNISLQNLDIHGPVQFTMQIGNTLTTTNWPADSKDIPAVCIVATLDGVLGDPLPFKHFHCEGKTLTFEHSNIAGLDHKGFTYTYQLNMLRDGKPVTTDPKIINHDS